MACSLRHAIAAALLGLCIAGPAAAAVGERVEASKQVDAAKLFTHYDAYLKLPMAERTHFTMAFYLRIGPAPLTAPVWLVEGDRKIPLPLRADGRVERLPTLAQLGADKVEIGVDSGTKLGLVIGLEPLEAPAVDLDAHELASAVAQAGPGMKKIAGVLGFALPTPKAVLFIGAPAGEAELADGRRVALPLIRGAPAYDPAAIPNARRIHLTKVPTKLDID
jgi:hypothetical protein